MGNGEILRPGEFQRMSAGTGITHSEFNPSPTEWVHLYQIWLRPERKGITPSYEQKSFPAEQRHNQWQVVAASDAADGALKIHQDAQIFLANLDAGVSLTHEISSGRHLWLQVLRGSVAAQDHSLSAGDGLAVSKETALTITATDAAEVMLFDLA
jgi:redox-sensitive bicupin YhaK (pirin superfamily)